MEIKFIDGKHVVLEVETQRHLARAATLLQAEGWMKSHQTQRGLEPGTIRPSLGQNQISQYDINTRFGFVESMVRMVANKDTVSAVITGRGGLGKTFTVRETLENSGITDIATLEQNAPVGARINRAKTFRFIKGYSTAKALYRSLYDNNNSVIVFDDCDSIQKDKTALNVLKSALDSYDKRIISWNAETKGDDDLPKSFQFDGKVIFISNLPMDGIDGAIKSRSMTVDLTMTHNQMLDRMEFLLHKESFLPNFDTDIKAESFALVKKLGNRIRNLNLRTLIKVCEVRANGEDNWSDMATYFSTNAD